MTLIASTELGAAGRYINFGSPPEQTDVRAQTVMAYVFQTSINASGNNHIFNKKLGVPWLRFFTTPTATHFGSASTGSASSPDVRGPELALSTWVNLAVTWDGSLAADSGMRMYSDGVNVTSLPVNGSGELLSDAGYDMYLMNRDSNNREFIGSLAYFARWNRVLSFVELEEARNNGPLNVPDGLILCWANQADLGPNNHQPISRSAFVAGVLPPNLNLGGDTPVIVDHATDGAVVGNAADVTGLADLIEPATVHQASGAVLGLASAVAGTARRFLHHAASGSANGNSAVVTGQAELINPVSIHETEGALTGQLGSVEGTAKRFRAHATEGVLVPTDDQGDPTAKVVGSAEVVSPAGTHECYGALTGQRGVISGAAKLTKLHVTSGSLVGKTAIVMGGATKFSEHDASGIVVGYEAKVVGTATNIGSLTLTPADIAAIVAALKAAVLPVNIVQVNYGNVDGDGNDNNPWGPE